jgi:hypothetical protein
MTYPSKTPGTDNGLRPISVVKHCKPDGLSPIDEESTAYAAIGLNNPDPPGLFWPIRKSDDLELEGCSSCLIAVVLDDDWTRVVCSELLN